MRAILDIPAPKLATRKRQQCVFVALPMRPSPRPPGVADAPTKVDPEVISLVRPSARGRFAVTRQRRSLLTLNFNDLWCRALNTRKDDSDHWSHWALCHDDIVPAPLWVDTIIDEMEASGADICSAVVPIKDDRGLTSTGVRNVKTGANRRLTMTEVFELPETFGIKDIDHGPDEILIVNSGLMVVRFTERWIEPPAFPGFVQLDSIIGYSDGTFAAATLSEDWCFSEWASRMGLNVIATRKTPLGHWDDAGKEYRNDSVWGRWTTDLGDNSGK